MIINETESILCDSFSFYNLALSFSYSCTLYRVYVRVHVCIVYLFVYVCIHLYVRLCVFVCVYGSLFYYFFVSFICNMYVFYAPMYLHKREYIRVLKYSFNE